MTKIHDGGAAYPSIRNVYDGGSGSRAEAHGGLTKREAFAMAAMQGVGTWAPFVPKPNSDWPNDDLTSDAVLKARAEWSVRQADALLAALRGDANG